MVGTEERVCVPVPHTIPLYICKMMSGGGRGEKVGKGRNATKEQGEDHSR